MADAVTLPVLPKSFKKPSFKSAFQFAWQEFRTEPEKYVIFSLLSVALPMLLGYISIIAKFLGLILFIGTPPLQTGTSAYYHHKAETGEKEFNFFFKPYFKILQLCFFQVIAIVGFIFITLPLTTWSVIITNSNAGADMSIWEMGLPIQIFSFITFMGVVYYAICITFAPYFIYYFNMPVKDALKKSFAIIHPRWLWFFGLFLFFVLIMLAGFACAVVGIFVSIPVVRLISYYVFSEYTGLDAKETENQ
jgi:hypothetical protein